MTLRTLVPSDCPPECPLPTSLPLLSPISTGSGINIDNAPNMTGPTDWRLNLSHSHLHDHPNRRLRAPCDERSGYTGYGSEILPAVWGCRVERPGCRGDRGWVAAACRETDVGRYGRRDGAPSECHLSENSLWLESSSLRACGATRTVGPCLVFWWQKVV